jgi:hypothetical protein
MAAVSTPASPEYSSLQRLVHGNDTIKDAVLKAAFLDPDSGRASSFLSSEQPISLSINSLNWMRHDPASILKFIDEYPTSFKNASEIVGPLFVQWIDDDPAMAMDYVSNVKNPQSRDEIFYLTSMSMHDKKLDEALQWANRIENEQTRAQAINSLSIKFKK